MWNDIDDLIISTYNKSPEIVFKGKKGKNQMLNLIQQLIK